MRSLAPIGVIGFLALASAAADAATISGTVTGPDGKAFRGAFVQARNLKTKITVSVLSDNAGHYRIDSLPAGDYRLQMRAIGYKADLKTGIELAADQNLRSGSRAAERHGALERHLDAPGQKLLPDARGKEELFAHCMACHGFGAAWPRWCATRTAGATASTICATPWATLS